jgi:hypothetical protein
LGKSYGTALNQVEHDTMDYNVNEAMVLAMIMSQFNERMQKAEVKVGQQHVIT